MFFFAQKKLSNEQKLQLDIANIQLSIDNKDFATASRDILDVCRRLPPLMIFVIPFNKSKEINKQLSDMKKAVDDDLEAQQLSNN